MKRITMEARVREQKKEAVSHTRARARAWYGMARATARKVARKGVVWYDPIYSIMTTARKLAGTGVGVVVEAMAGEDDVRRGSYVSRPERLLATRKVHEKRTN